MRVEEKLVCAVGWGLVMTGEGTLRVSRGVRGEPGGKEREKGVKKKGGVLVEERRWGKVWEMLQRRVARGLGMRWCWDIGAVV